MMNITTEKEAEKMAYVCSICGKRFTNGIQDHEGKLYCSQQCYQATWPRCTCCGKPMSSWTERNGGKYCSEKCLESSYPKCAMCGRPMKQWLATDDGQKFCSEVCFEKTLPRCAVCGRHMNSWIEDQNGTKFCSESCADAKRPKCAVCGKLVREGYRDSKGQCYCSERCFDASLPKCSVCGKPVRNGFRTNSGYFCSEECFETTLPRCAVCGKPVNGGYVDSTGKHYCSDACYEATLPKCDCCGKRLHQWIETDDRKHYCNELCMQRAQEQPAARIEMESALTAEELSYLTGLSAAECHSFMETNHLNGEEALEAIDIFMQSLNDGVAVPVEITSCMNNAGIYAKMSQRLGAYNTMRGGTKGYGGFVFEELHAADAASKGADISVLGDNSIADFIVKDASGKETLVQAKAGYKANQIDWSRYKGQTIVVDKGNTVLADEARAAGLTVQESAVFKKEADIVARAQQWEGELNYKLTGSRTAPVAGTLTGAHYAGVASAKLAARVGVSTKLGESIYDVLSGDKEFSEAAADVVVDGAVLVGSTYLGSAALTVAGSAVSALAGTTAGAAVTGAVTGAAAAIGSTAVGSAVVAGTGAVLSGAAAAVSAVAAAPLLPVAGVFAAIGFIGKWLRS